MNTLPTGGVHVQVSMYLASRLSCLLLTQTQMETFESPSDKSYMEFDAAGNIVKTTDFDSDPEGQVIDEKFKRPPY